MRTITKMTRLGACTVLTVLSFSTTSAQALSLSTENEFEANATQVAPTKPEVTDGQILKVILTIDINEIALSALAVRKAQTRAVQEFAQQMIDQHGNMNKMVSALGQSAQIQAVDAPIAASLRDQGQADLRELSQLPNTQAFDLAFMEKQIVAHQMALKMLGETLLPNASNPSVKTLIRNAQPVVQQHLEMAEKIRADLK